MLIHKGMSFIYPVRPEGNYKRYLLCTIPPPPLLTLPSSEKVSYLEIRPAAAAAAAAAAARPGRAAGLLQRC
jgi:hypothetical protein